MIQVHCNVLSGKATWTVDRAHAAEPEDLIKLTFSTAAFATIHEREAYEIIRGVLRNENVSWARPASDEWLIDLEPVADMIGDRQGIGWLKGTLRAKPKFVSEILSAGPPKVGSGDFVFYISPDELERSASGTSRHDRTKVFISYSHADKKWVERVRVHLRPMERRGLVEVFDDSLIKPGEPWRERISAALDQAKVALLLVSADFIASDFIAENELPPLLKRAANGGATIMPVIVSPCRFTREENLARFQSVNDPKRPLESLTYSDSEQVLTDLADAIEGILRTDRDANSANANNATSSNVSPPVELRSEAASELLVLMQAIVDDDNRGIVEILDSPEPGHTFFLPGLRDAGSPYKMKSRLFREAVAELVNAGWLYPPEHTGKTKRYEYKHNN